MDSRYVGTKSKATAAVLAGLLGCFGAHRFYLRRKGSAVVQLIFCGLAYILGIVLMVNAVLLNTTRYTVMSWSRRNSVMVSAAARRAWSLG